ncbi:hypothetical protein ACIQZB_12305 [Streptomyces sp. NPDC097727]
MRVGGAGLPVFEAGGPMPHGVAESTVGAETRAVVDPGGETFRLL